MIGRLAFALALWPQFGAALTLDFPGNAELSAQEITPDTSYDLPTGPWRDGMVPTERFEGEKTRQIWQIAVPGVTTLQLLAPLRQQLRREGYDVLFDCVTQACGGFDFRFGTEVAGPPEMIVDLGEYRFLSAKSADGTEGISILISRSADRSYAQVIRIGQATGAAALASTDAPALRQVAAAAAESPTPPTDFGTMLDQEGHAILSDLTFESGSAQLAAGRYASLEALAKYLRENPNRTVALVGHTDASGGLDGNIALSKRRAGSVLERLATEYDVARSQLDAQGMGYLAPITTNLTPEGREKNRRVEVIVTSTE